MPMEFVNEKKLCLVKSSNKGIPCLKQISVVWLSMVLLVITMDLLSFIQLLSFPGGYAFPVIAFVYFSLAPRVWSIVLAFTGCLTPAVLFLLMNLMIIAILLSSGFLATLTKEDMSSLLPSQSEDSNSGTLTRSASDSGRPKAMKKMKRQHSAPPALQQQQRSESDSDEFPGEDVSAKQEGACLKSIEQWHSSSLIIMELPSSEAGDHHGGKAQGMSLYSNHLMTCDQDAFNEIIGNYIDKFKQEIRQQELKGYSSSKW